MLKYSVLIAALLSGSAFAQEAPSEPKFSFTVNHEAKKEVEEKKEVNETIKVSNVKYISHKKHDQMIDKIDGKKVITQRYRMYVTCDISMNNGQAKSYKLPLALETTNESGKHKAVLDTLGLEIEIVNDKNLKRVLEDLKEAKVSDQALEKELQRALAPMLQELF